MEDGVIHEETGLATTTLDIPRNTWWLGEACCSITNPHSWSRLQLTEQVLKLLDMKHIFLYFYFMGRKFYVWNKLEN